MKNKFRAVISALTAITIAAGPAAFSASAAGGAAAPKLTVSSCVLSMNEVRSGNAVSVDLCVSGTNDRYCSTGIHLQYDPRLTIVQNKREMPDVKRGDAIDWLVAGAAVEDPLAKEAGMKGIFLTTAGDSDFGRDGVMWTVAFLLPEDIKGGEVFPIDIVYRSDPEAIDLFTNFDDDADGQLMNSWTFTQGIYNKESNNNFSAPASDIAKCAALAAIDKSVDGYIAVEDISMMPVTTTTQKPVTTTTTKKPVTTTTTKKPAAVTTTTAKPVAVTTTASTKKSTTTTKKTTAATTTQNPAAATTTATTPLGSGGRKYGDVNGDNSLTVADATLLLQHLGNGDKYKLNATAKIAADVDGTPGLSALDALVILQVDAGIYKQSQLPLKSVRS